ncbi:MAG TPA: LL-diaminopimelate aminotransferase [Thermoleophilia bacterium]|nr:LL-diaminopimelate aminotransferase [Thermoleophilia bacterium]HQG03722.1 LL-diaminopimelate aminotransferase [Thermoleophilia bacterium]HQJ97036.1 LL-diaminopimelate aminotransferase [Thermoleophilia bacterium]
MTPSRRVQDLPPYLFAEIERKVAARRAAGVDVISLGIGDPDMPTPGHIVEALIAGARDPATHQYPSNRGEPAFREAVAGYYARRFGVTLDVETEIVPLLGAKEGVAHICTTLLDPDDVCLAADPGYPVYTAGPLLADAEAVPLPLVPELGFQPDLEAVPADVLERAKMLFVCYPNNPTGAVVEDDFFARLVAFAKTNDLVVVHDNAYADITFDGYVAPSFLATPGAKEVGVELFSLSKSYNMTGWRAGAIVGDAEVVEAYWRLKTNVDSGMFGAVQRAAAAALDGPQDCVREMCDVYAHRRDLLVEALRAIGLSATPPKGTIYLWAPVPEGHTSASFTELVLEQADVIVSPGAAYGPSGEGFVRFSLTVPDARLHEAVQRIAERVRL